MVMVRSSSSSLPATRFDPAQWHALYDQPQLFPAGFVFRRSVEVVERFCADVAQPGQLWVDIGCGTGVLTTILSRQGLCVFGVDHDRPMVTFARTCQRDHGIDRILPFLSGQAEYLPFRNSSIDGVVAVSLTGCLPCLDGFLHDVHRVLRCNGYAILTFMNEASVLVRASDLLRQVVAKARSRTAPFSYRHPEKKVLEALSRSCYHIRAIHHYNYCVPIGNQLFPPVSIARRCEQIGKSPILSRRLARNFTVVVQKRSA